MNKHWIAHVVAAIIIVTLLAIILSPSETRIDNSANQVLEKQNEALQSTILKREAKIFALSDSLDSITAIKTQPKYIIRYETINNLDSSSAFDSVAFILDSYIPELE